MYKYDRHGHRVLCPRNYSPLPTPTPFQLFYQNFAQGLHDEDILPFGQHLNDWNNSHRPQRLHSGLESGRSQVECTKDMFQMKLDVQHFAPQEIDVKVVEDCVVIKGKHDERMDYHGHVTREFTRKYHLPSGVKSEDVSCSVSSDGVLCISGKREPPPAIDEKETPLAIMHTGEPAASVRVAHAPGGSCCSMRHDKIDENNGDDAYIKK